MPSSSLDGDSKYPQPESVREPLAKYTTRGRVLVKIDGYPFYILPGTVLEANARSIRQVFKEPADK